MAWRDVALWAVVSGPPPSPSAPLSRGSAFSGPPVQPAVNLADGRGGLRLAEVALAASQTTLHDQATHHARLDLLKVIRLSADFGLEEADVRLIPSLLLRERDGGGDMGVLRQKDQKKMNQEQKQGD